MTAKSTEEQSQQKEEKEKSFAFQSVRGMHDILPQDQPYWQRVREVFREEAEVRGYGRIDTPILENSFLFTRGIGQDTELVQKEMYSFKTKGGEQVSLRPEGTAPAVRAYLEHGLSSCPQPVKFYYLGPYFRYDRPQKGRFRQFHQLGLEAIGSDSPALEAEAVKIVADTLEALGIENYIFQVNSIGDRSCRPAYLEKLLEYLKAYKGALPKEEWERVLKRPLHIFDSKSEKAQQVAKSAPKIIDNLDKDCHRHFEEFLEILDELEISYNLNPKVVRGLDYYTRTVFEIWASDDSTGQNALGGGGRYDYLAEQLGGPPTPASGVAVGIERLVELMKTKQVSLPRGAAPWPQLFLAQLSPRAKRYAFKLFDRLRASGLSVTAAFERDSLKSQLRAADRLGVNFVLILGQKELTDGKILLRDMSTGTQEILPLNRLVTEIKKRFNIK
jgi:histidyl-tRNA synthetase